MGSNLYSALNRLRLGVAMSAAIDRAMGRGVRCYFMHTKTTTTFGQAKSKKKGSDAAAAAALFSRLVSSEEIDDVKSKLDGWVKEQDKEEVSQGELFKSIIQNLCQRGRFARALEVFEWMNEKGIYKFSPQDRALQLKFICRVQGCSAAERYFSSLPEREKNEETCGTLLRCYVQQTQTEKALLHFQHMKELGFASSSLPYNEIMCLYANNGQLEKVPEVLDEMKKSKVLPDNDSYRTCISSFGSRCDLDGVEKMLKEMETQPHTVMDWFTYALAAKFYREAGGLQIRPLMLLGKQRRDYQRMTRPA
ncbi:hypothetical protein DM860_010224 [Cuscuta australis]|uniref:Pentacotripeptide-repeat region of PRORP domain-containing protein n=1 Tax=Cuscuta australis TaxID=267555 RepID=A0A328D8C7_9ASTE|nr:hypothetical protein DM860_010224 [Cuscuta australis]